MSSDKSQPPSESSKEPETFLKVRVPKATYDILCQVSNQTGRSLHSIGVSALNVAARGYAKDLNVRKRGYTA